MKSPKESSIIVCSIVKDAEKEVRHNITVISELCKEFKDYKIIIFENDSRDATRDVLESWAELDRHVVLPPYDACNAPQPCNVPKGVNPFFSMRRIEKMAFLRNQYMRYISVHNLSADYLLVVDLDVKDIDIKGVLSSFYSDVDWDAVCANGWSIGPNLRRRYHDTYALSEWEMRDVPQTESMIKALGQKYGSLKLDDSWVRIMSGFGGLAIYHFDLVKDFEYQAIRNADTSVEARCEHYSIYSQILEKGASRFYINPSMIIKYQDINLAIVFQHIKRKILYLFSR